MKIRRKTSLFVLALLTTAAPLLATAADRDQAISVLEQSVKTNPGNAELWVHLGFAYKKQNQIDQSQSAFEKAVSLDPKNHEALYMLGLIYEKKGRTQDAQRVWKQYMDSETDPAKKQEAEKHLHHVSQ